MPKGGPTYPRRYRILPKGRKCFPACDICKTPDAPLGTSSIHFGMRSDVCRSCVARWMWKSRCDAWRRYRMELALELAIDPDYIRGEVHPLRSDVTTFW